jgi:quercetin dioxygenase-like cupin family protein
MSRVSVVRGRDLEPVVSPRPDQVGLRLRRLLQAESGTSTFVIAETEIPAGRRHEMHRHPHAEQAIYVLRGSLTLVGPEAEPVILQAGDIVHVPAGQWHGTINESAQDAATLTVFGGVSRAADAGYEEYDAGESP